MTKTPEELAFNYALNILETRILDSIQREEARLGFLAGYQAAQEQFADTSKVMPDTCEHILDMEKMVDVNGWISVRERMPPPEVTVLWWNETADQSGVSSYKYMSHCNDTMIEWGDAGYLSIKNFTHWMPLPAAPKEEK